MPFEDDTYAPRTVQTLQSQIEAELRAEFGQDIDLTESSTFTTLAEVVATVTNQNQEQSLQDVYEAAFLSTATGDDLEKVVAIVGLQRRAATHATGVERFTAGGKVESDYTIQTGTTVQTAGSEPIEFETTEPTTLQLYDDFEDTDLSEYSGNTADVSVTSGTAYNGVQSLQLAAQAGSHIYNNNLVRQQGSRTHVHLRPLSGTEPIYTFGVSELDQTDYYQVVLDETAQEARLEVVVGGSVSSVLDTTSLTVTAQEYHEIEVDWQTTNDIDVTVYDDTGDTTLGTLSATDDTYTRGYVGYKSGDGTDTKQFDFSTTSATSANIRAVQGGIIGNVGPNTIVNTPTPPAGVNEVTNPYPTGDPDFDDTDQVTFASGRVAESDEALRERAQDAVSQGGDATADALVSALINDVSGVSSVTLYENKTDIDNTGSGGLPPHSFEAVVFGGENDDVAEAIFETKAVTARDYSGVNGTSVTETVVADSNQQQWDIEFSRPAKLDVDMTIDIVVDDTYVGDDEIRDQLTQVIGGTLSNQSEVVGLGVGEDVIVDQLKDTVVGDENGVIALDNSVDGSPFTTTPAITTVDGIDVIDVGANEVAQTDATDASITLNTRTQ